ncbi:MAG: DUF445 family protein [Spirochaetales bacterium]|nr:DUF445 family protein [Spirochaetales bacterium]
MVESVYVRILLPPLLGAIIGYVTNALAIRMLFRPLREYRIGPFRVPFTPGIIPRQRHRLAASIARMVSRELLTEDTLYKRLEEPLFRQRVFEKLSDFSDYLLSTPLNRLIGSIPAEVQNAFHLLFTTAAQETLEKREGKSTFRTILEEILNALWEFRISPSFFATLARWIREGEWIKITIHGRSTLKDLFPGLTSLNVRKILEPVYPVVYARLVAVLKTPEVKEELSFRGRFLLRDILAELNFFQRLLLTAGQYDRTLEERMPFIVEDILEAVEEAGADVQMRDRILDAVKREVENLLEQPLSTVTEKLGKNGEQLLEQGLEAFIRAGRMQIAASLEGWIRREADEEEGLCLGELIRRLFRLGQDQDLTQRVLEILAGLFLQEAKRFPTVFQKIVEASKRALRDLSICDLFPLTLEEKRSIDTFLTTAIFDILKTKIPVVLSAIDVEDLVLKRIDALDVREVEELLLSVIAKHLTWINIFGGILGACIGAFQVLLQYIP